MRNESENGGHGRESNPTSSAIAAAALTSELQTIPMVYWHICSSNLSLFSKFLNTMTILSYFIPWIFNISDQFRNRYQPHNEQMITARFSNFSIIQIFSNFLMLVITLMSYPRIPQTMHLSHIVGSLISDSSSPEPLIVQEQHTMTRSSNSPVNFWSILPWNHMYNSGADTNCESDQKMVGMVGNRTPRLQLSRLLL